VCSSDLLTGGVETNRRGKVYQLEVVGFAKHIPTYSGEWFAALAAEVRWICGLLDVPILFPRRFLPYPASYGDNGVRFTHSEWATATGIIGHQHVPENAHGDPGDLTRLTTILAPNGAPVLKGPPPMPTNANWIVEAQRLLRNAGYDPGDIDGDWGPLSNAALHAMKNSLFDVRRGEEEAQQSLGQARTVIDGLEAQLAAAGYISGELDAETIDKAAKLDAIKAALS